MKHFIFLTNYYLPKPGATALCVHQVANFLSLNNKVDVVCFENDKNEKCFGKIQVHYVKIPSFLKQNRFQNSFAKRFFRLRNLLNKFLNFANYPLRSKTLANSYIQCTKKLIVDPSSTVVIASFNPIEAVYSVMKLKKEISSLKTVYYSLDTLSNEKGNTSFLPMRYRNKKEIAMEKLLFEFFDRILIMECHRNHYMSNDFDLFKSKFYIANFPLLTTSNRSVEIVYSNKKDTRCKKAVFVGTFYRKLRNPTFLCNILNNLLKEVPLNVSFLGGGDCQDILESFEKKHSSNVEVLGMQPHDVALQYIQSADILISVGNVNSPMAPSKIYEYMATGKPILHIYSYKDDPCIEPLKKYGNALLINQESPIDFENVVSFINNSSCIKTDEVFEMFKTSTPAYTANILDF